MSKVVFISDIHLTHKNPPSRVDDFLTSVFKKLDFVFSFCVENNSGLIIGGDIFNNPVINPSVESKFISLVVKYNLPFVYIIPGNHDLLYSSFSYLDRTSYNVLLSTGLFKTDLFVTDDFVIDFINAKNLVLKDYSLYKSLNKSVILVGHGYIKGGLIYDDWFYDFDSIKSMNPDVVCLGHIHNPYEVQSFESFILVRPGGISRLTSSYDDISRGIFLSLISKENGKIKAENIPIPYESNVFSDKTQIKKRISYDEIKEYISTSFSKRQNTQFNSIIQYLDSLNLDVKVKSELMNRLALEGLI